MRRKHPKTWYRETKAALRQRDGDECWICLKPTTLDDQTIDHWIPESLGGSDELVNLRLVHAACNRRRGNTLPVETLSKPRIIAARRRDKDEKRHHILDACGNSISAGPAGLLAGQKHSPWPGDPQ